MRWTLDDINRAAVSSESEPGNVEPLNTMPLLDSAAHPRTPSPKNIVDHELGHRLRNKKSSAAAPLSIPWIMTPRSNKA